MTKRKENPMRIKSLSLIIGFLVVISLAQTADATVSLSMQPFSQNVASGSQFTVDMNLSNPASEQLSTLNVWMSFDPTYLQVIDSDAGNWITTGTNVLDGPYHSAFNWDLHVDNSADNAAGRISYAEGSISTNVIGSGTFAQIKFLAKAPVLNTPINYIVTGTGSVEDTYVADNSATNILAGTSGATVNVVPEPGSILLLGSGLLGMFGLVRRRRS